jgi:catechol 2,3-dioxygenase-like lactoylglutathione lyase family enzyme
MINCVEHIAIASRNPRKLAEWYTQYLNFSFLKVIGPTVYIRDANGVVLEFVPADTIPFPPRIRDLGLRHIAFQVGDIENAYRTLEHSGAKFMPEPVVNEGMRLHFFQDPEGNFLHLVQRESRLL